MTTADKRVRAQFTLCVFYRNSLKTETYIMVLPSIIVTAPPDESFLLLSSITSMGVTTRKCVGTWCYELRATIMVLFG
jgi:hypothetical protein